MRKNYLKPDIFFEDFAFSSNIAASCSSKYDLHGLGTTSCEATATFGNPVTCEFYDNGYVVFQELGPCLEVPQENDPNNLCYHVSSDDTRIFAS